ncbi:hypothetical protein [Oryzobacter terrae]|uniref:hypothetical protein n=1 Tax=Oryzobacter terrae TaxID=1620385 RepID=UPI00366AC5B4
MAIATTALSGPMVVGSTVVRAGTLVPVLTAAGLVMGVASRVLRSRRPRLPTTAARRSVAVVLVVAAVLTACVVWFRDLGVSYTVLAPASPGGCRVVVGQVSFLMAGSGTVHELPDGSVLAREVGGFMADDGIRPVDEGNVELTWSGEQGVLRLWGRPGDPVDPGLHELDCRSG